MATRQSIGVFPNRCSTDAEFRNVAQFIEDTLVTTGTWVVTGDTGQTAVNTLVAPTLTDQKKGYRVYRMDDALQSTRPVFMRIDYGSAGGATIVGLWITIGSGSNGSGTITGAVITDERVGGNTSSATNTNHYGSADKNRFTIAVGVATTNIGHFLMSLERTKDANGNDTTDGLYFANTRPADGGSTRGWRVLNLTGVGGQPPDETGFSYVLSHNNPTSFNGTVGVGLVIPFKGVAVQPGYNLTISRTSDFIVESTFTLTVYGQVRTYQLLNASHNVIQNLTLAADSAARWAIRFD